MVWICESCGSGNLDIFNNCIKCSELKKIKNDENLNCWDYLNCSTEKREKCIVFVKNTGVECYNYKNISKRCNMDNDNSCTDCEWYKFIKNKD